MSLRGSRVLNHLSDRQARFTESATDLLVYAKFLGLSMKPACRIRLDYARRCDDCPANEIKSSNHTRRLAVDLIIDSFIGGQWTWITGSHPFFDKLGEFWLAYGRVNNLPTRWGGTWAKRDYSHFSFEYEGIS